MQLWALLQVKILPRSHLKRTKGNQMYINQIEARNLSGQPAFNHKLGKVTLFHGSNFSGKTTRLNALTLLLGGYLPGVASKPNEVYEYLATGNPLVVSGTTDGGVRLSRSWMEQRGSVKATREGDLDLPPVALDPSGEFLGLSGPARTRFLFRLCTMSEEFTVAKMVQSLVANVKNVKLESNTEESEAGLTAVVELLNGTVLTTDTERTPQAWVEQLVETVSEKKKAAVAAVQRMEKTGQGQAQIALQGAPPSPDAEQKLARARKALEDALAEQSRLEEVGKAEKQTHKEAGDLAATAVNVEATQARIKALEEEMVTGASAGVLPAGDAPKRPVVVGQRPDDAVTRQAVTDAAKVAVKLDGAVTQAEVERERLRKEIEEAQGAKTCSKCGQSIAKLQEKVITLLGVQFAAAAKVYDIAQKARLDYSPTETAAVAKLSEVQQNQAAWDKAVSKANAHYDKAVGEWSHHNTLYIDAQAELKRLAGVVAEMKEKVTNNAAAAEASAKLPVLALVLEKARENYTAAKAVTDTRRTEVAAAEADYKRLLALRAEKAASARAASELARARVDATVWKETQKLVAALQVKLLDAAVGPLIATANELCGSILRAPLVWQDGEIGMRATGGSIVTKRTWSGTETALIHCALSIALAAGAPFRLAFIDELGRLDSQRRVAFVKLLLELIEAGKLDQAVMTDVRPLGATEPLPGFTEVEVAA